MAIGKIRALYSAVAVVCVFAAYRAVAVFSVVVFICNCENEVPTVVKIKIIV